MRSLIMLLLSGCMFATPIFRPTIALADTIVILEDDDDDNEADEDDEECPAGFEESEEKCTPEEREDGCRDIRLDNGKGCVDR